VMAPELVVRESTGRVPKAKVPPRAKS